VRQECEDKLVDLGVAAALVLAFPVLVVVTGWFARNAAEYDEKYRPMGSSHPCD
jgi:hypothetical protein